MPSPLHCLENSLKGILPGRPLRFACLASPSPGPSPSSGSSSSSSFSSSEEDLRLEPKLWQALLQGKLVGETRRQGAVPQAGALALTPALFVTQRGTLFPAARVLALRPHALVAPPLAAALVKAQGKQSPGTTSASVQVSLGLRRGACPRGAQVQRLSSLSPTSHFA